MSGLTDTPPAGGWFGNHVAHQGGGIIALVAPPDPTQSVEDGWAFSGQVHVMVLTKSPGRTTLHLSTIRAGLDSAVFSAERLGEHATVEAVNASAIYQRLGTEERRFSPVTRLDDHRKLREGRGHG